MAKHTLTDAFFEWNSVDLSAWVRSVDSAEINLAEVDGTTMGTNGVAEILAGLQTFNFSITFAADEAASAVAQTLFADAIAKTARAIEIRPTSGAKSATNPGYQTTLRITSYPLLGGAVGELDTQTVVMRSTGVAMTRATS